MPLTKKGKKIRRAVRRKYGKTKGDRILYAGENSGKFTGIHYGGKRKRA